jgi:hypothetical protein
MSTVTPTNGEEVNNRRTFGGSMSSSRAAAKRTELVVGRRGRTGWKGFDGDATLDGERLLAVLGERSCPRWRD